MNDELTCPNLYDSEYYIIWYASAFDAGSMVVKEVGVK